MHLDGKLNFDDWAEGIKQGRSYVSDGKSHLIDFSVNGLGVGLKNSDESNIRREFQRAAFVHCGQQSGAHRSRLGLDLSRRHRQRRDVISPRQ